MTKQCPVISTALTLAQQAYCVLPTLGSGPSPGVGWADGSRHLPEVQWLFSRRRYDGVGVACGERSGAWAVTIDGLKGRRSLRDLIEAHSPLPLSPVSVDVDGWSWWFSWEPGCDLPNGLEFLPGMIVRSDGSGVVVPPGRAHWRDISLLDAEPAQAPPWLLDAILCHNTPMAVGL